MLADVILTPSSSVQGPTNDSRQKYNPLNIGDASSE